MNKGAGVPKRTRRPSTQAARDRILEIAEQVIAKDSPVEFQLQEVAQRLGVKAPALYNHFRGRDDLVGQVSARGNHEIYEVMERKAGEDFWTWIRRAVRDLVTLLAQRPAIARLILWDIAHGDVDTWGEEAVERDREFLGTMERHFEEARRLGLIRNIRFEHFHSYMYSGISGSLLFHSIYPDAKMAEISVLQDEAEDFVVRMLRREPDRSGPESQ